MFLFLKKLTYSGVAKGGQPNPPAIEKIGKTPPVQRSRTPLRRVKRAGKFLGFFRDF